MNAATAWMIVMGLLFEGGMAGLAASVMEDLVPNGGFENVGDTGLPENWSMNATYPGEVKLVKDKARAHGGQRYLYLGDPVHRTQGVGLVCSQRLAGNRKTYAFKVYGRGNGRITFCFSAWSPNKWIATLAGPSMEINDPEKWILYEGTITVPERLAANGAKQRQDLDDDERDNGVVIQSVIPVIFVAGDLDLDDVSLMETRE